MEKKANLVLVMGIFLMFHNFSKRTYSFGPELFIDDTV